MKTSANDLLKTKGFLTLYSCCVPVKGKESGCIYHLQKHKIFYVPNSLIDLLEHLRKHTVIELATQVSSLKLYRENIKYLLDHNLAFFTDTPHRFPLLNMQFFAPEKITNAIVEIENLKNYDIKKVFDNLSDCLCKQVEVRIISEFLTKSDLQFIFKAFQHSTIRSANVVLKYSKLFDLEDLIGFFKAFKKVRGFLVYNSPEKFVPPAYPQIGFLKHNLEDKFLIEFPKKVLNPHFKHFTESHRFNVYHNNKVAINRNGEIKNDIKLKQVFGNINDLEHLYQVVDTEAFKKLWLITVDMIEGIKDLPERYAMTISNNIILKDNKYYLEE